MALLELPQELLDEIASHLDAHALLALRETGKYVYHAVGGDASLRVALVKLEQYWASAAHVCAVQFNYIDQEPYPSYKRYLGRAPCFTCLRISTPQNTHRPRHQYPGWNMPMLPWRGDYDGRGREDRLGLFRECIDCTIKRRVAALARLAPATEKARARVAAKIDPRKTKGELPLDWALWKHVYEPASRHEHRWALYSKLKPALKHMQRYLAWMDFIDDRQQVCPHKAIPPAMDVWSELGEWPQWEQIAVKLRNTVEDWDTADCGLGCKFARGVEVWDSRLAGV
ncbi:hypothetical protein LTR56_000154 [Elasticomyces elasticus]|nr:hypothetical protein LTR56_000154 [Elasticomyces elasticus]KAK3667142.1 hypothetical protein LTR22_002007 [Elasticomyces elasticus]KAK4932916.1 hypothetical protein LTR49_000873 [Elasticomyces elasticus]